MLEEGKYYICSSVCDGLVCEKGFSDIKDAIEEARVIGECDGRSCCLYIQPTEKQDGNVVLLGAEYVISVNGGRDDTGCYSIDEVIL